jgi:transcriptional regulator with XRE-family HTH domain
MSLFFGKNLRHLRTLKELNQAEIGEIVGKGGNTIGNWEKGNAEPNFIELTQIVNFFGVPIFDIMYTDLETAHLIKEEKEGKKQGKSTPFPTPNSTPNRLNEPLVDFKKAQKTPEQLIAMLEEIVNDKSEINANLRARIGELENQIKALEKKLSKQKESHA